MQRASTTSSPGPGGNAASSVGRLMSVDTNVSPPPETLGGAGARSGRGDVPPVGGADRDERDPRHADHGEGEQGGGERDDVPSSDRDYVGRLDIAAHEKPDGFHTGAIGCTAPAVLRQRDISATRPRWGSGTRASQRRKL
ncbi:hypothetical protein AB5I41_12910 [Sphingomonas sp. MMS24-JH45]